MSIMRVIVILSASVAVANGQISFSSMSCATNVASSPAIRANGYTEQTGDIIVTCSGGSAITPGNPIPTVNITAFFNTPVTSRLLFIGSNVSEALLRIDEPGSGLIAPAPGFGPEAPQNLCSTPLTGCAEFASLAGGVIVATDIPGGTTPGKNVFQGIVSSNSVTFFGIPILPPASVGAFRTFRITNVRVNATVLNGGPAAGANPVIGLISVSNAATLPVTNSTPTVGVVFSGLSTSASAAAALGQCSSQSKSPIATLSFTENFGTAFKTRVAVQTNTLYAGQTIPGAS